MVEIISIDNLLHFMLNKISLGRQDKRFITNLQTFSTVTSNQVKLLHKIISKYRKQFSAHELFVEKLLELPWSARIIESSPEYTGAYISIVNNEIIFKCPYNRDFINEFRRHELNDFVWYKDKRYYKTEYGQHALKLVVDISTKYFSVVNFCPITKHLLDYVNQYQDARIWQPTLVQVNDNLLIAATNEALDGILSTHPLSTDLISLSRLASCGVTIDQSLYDKEDKKHNFFVNCYSKIDVSEINNVIEWIKELKIEYVILHSMHFYHIHVKKFIKALQDENIYYVDVNASVIPESYKDKSCILVTFKTKNFFEHIANVVKCVQFTDSEPINIL